VLLFHKDSVHIYKLRLSPSIQSAELNVSAQSFQDKSEALTQD